MDKKNTLLLTVIAIATLLVAVVGATFAYFSAQGSGEAGTANFEVHTSNKDLVSYSSVEPIYIIANKDNFVEVGEQQTGNIGSQKGISHATVEYIQGDEAKNTKGLCYSVSVKITANDFDYAPIGTDYKSDANKPQDGGHAPELLLKLTKHQKTGTVDTPPSGGSDEVYTQAITSGDTDTFNYVTVKGERRVCTQTGSTEGVVGSYTCTDSNTISGYDVTGFNTNGEGTLPKTLNIPATNGGNTYEHKLKGTNANDKIVDEWTAELVFVNYDWDQQYNVGKQFKAEWQFTTANECSE